MKEIPSNVQFDKYFIIVTKSFFYVPVKTHNILQCEFKNTCYDVT